MNTGALVLGNANSGVWDVVASAPGHPGVGVTAYYEFGWLTPILFTNVADAAGNEVSRFIWTDANGQHYVDLGPYLPPPVVISQDPTTDFYREQLDLFTTTRSGTNGNRSALQWARVTTGNIIDRQISWQTLANDLPAGAEQITPVSWGPGRLDVFITDSGGNIWHKWNDSRTTGGWYPAT